MIVDDRTVKAKESLSGIGTRIVKFLTIPIRTSYTPLLKRWGRSVWSDSPALAWGQRCWFSPPTSGELLFPAEQWDQRKALMRTADLLICFWRFLTQGHKGALEFSVSWHHQKNRVLSNRKSVLIPWKFYMMTHEFIKWDSRISFPHFKCSTVITK